MVSIIVPVYNVEDYLADCIESILGQTHSDLELILIDDGSIDSSASICRSYCLNDDRVRYIQQGNMGAAAARNKGIDASRGEWITFVDSDDVLRNDALELLLKAAVQNTVDIACGRFTYSIEELHKGRGAPHRPFQKAIQGRELLHYSFVGNHSWGKLYASRLFKSTGIRYPAGRRYEEDTAIMYLLFEASSSVAITEEPLYYYRIRKGSVTAVPLTEDIEDLKRTYEEVKRYYASDFNDSCLIYQASILYDIQRVATISNAAQSIKKKAYSYVKSEYSSAMFRAVLRHLDKPMGKKLLLMKTGLVPILLTIRHRKSKCDR